MARKSKAKTLMSGSRQRFLIFVLAFAAIATYLLLSIRAATVAPTLTYSNWYWPSSSTGYESFEWDVTPKTDPSPQGYFWSHQFQFKNGDGGYFGLQTQGSNPTGKIAIMSIWEALAAESPEYANTFGGEGVGYTVRIKYPWQVNKTYRLKVAKMTGTSSENWWGGWVTDVASGVQSYVGRIKIQPTWTGLGTWSVMWTEFYSPVPSTCSGMNYASAVFSKPIANGSILPNSQNNQLSNPVNCPGSKITDVSNGVWQEMSIPSTQPPSPSDTTAPTVTIGSPQNGQFITGRTQITATAADDQGVATFELFIDGKLKQSSNDNAIVYTWNPPKGKGKNNDGSHVIEFKAKDQAGNVGQSSITVTTK